MSDDDFYEDDEPLEDILWAWNQATERGYTTGSFAPIRTIVWPIDFGAAVYPEKGEPDNAR